MFDFDSVSRLHDRIAFAALSLLLLLMASTTFSATPNPASACIDRQPSAVPSEPLRLPELTYECLALKNGRHVLLGRAGREQRDVVLLVHGLGTYAHRDWRKVIPELATNYRVLTLDLPGFGASEGPLQGYSFETLATTLVEILDGESVQRATVVGHSLGGALTLYFAHTHPQRVERLVLVDVAGILLKSVYVHHVSQINVPESGIDPVDRLLNAVDRRINGLNRRILQHFENTFDFSTWLAANPAIRIALLGGFTQTDAALGLIEHDFTRAIRETNVPTTVIWGRNDDVSPLRVGQLLAARLPDARLHVIERTGHVPMTESPRAFMPLLMQALAEPARTTVATAPAGAASPIDCRNESNRQYTGRFTTITLVNCHDIRIGNAHLDKLTMSGSSTVLDDVTIDASDVAIEAKDSFITATVLKVNGRIALSVDNSQLDLAGVSIRATERSVRSTNLSRIYYSVSDVQAPDFSGDAHRIWNAPP